MRSAKTVKAIVDYLVKHAEITFRIEPEDNQIEGNCSAIDDETDRATEQWIRDQIASGNQASWCIALVTVTYKGFMGRDSLGCCSYESEEKLIEELRDDMVREACLDLANQLMKAEDVLNAIRLNARKEKNRV